MSGSSSSILQKFEPACLDSQQAIASLSQSVRPECSKMGKRRFGLSGRYRSDCPGAMGAANSNAISVFKNRATATARRGLGFLLKYNFIRFCLRCLRCKRRTKVHPFDNREEKTSPRLSPTRPVTARISVTPAERCEERIVDAIDRSRSSIRLEACPKHRGSFYGVLSISAQRR